MERSIGHYHIGEQINILLFGPTIRLGKRLSCKMQMSQFWLYNRALSCTLHTRHGGRQGKACHLLCKCVDVRIGHTFDLALPGGVSLEVRFEGSIFKIIVHAVAAHCRQQQVGSKS